MKKLSIKKLTHNVIVAMLLSVLLVSCEKFPNGWEKPTKKKKDKHKNECSQQMNIMASDASGNFTDEAQTTIVYVTNWQELNTVSEPGVIYEVVYTPMECEKPFCEGDNPVYNNQNSGIREGGCIPYYNKRCIKVCSIKKKTCTKDTDCNGLSSEFNNDWSYNVGKGNAVLNSDILNMDIAFSGCGDDYKNCVLLYDKASYLQDINSDIMTVKAVFMGDVAPLCNAFFYRNICFNLNEIKQFVLTTNVKPAPKTLKLKIEFNENNSQIVPWQMY